MDFLDNLVLPQSSHHITLLKYLLALSYIIFIPYISILFGSLVLSIYSFKKENLNGSRLAKDFIDLVTYNKSMSIGLGAVPMLCAIFCYAQLLHDAPINISGFLVISLILFIIGITLIYVYKRSFHLREIFNLAFSKIDAGDKANAELYEYRQKNELTFSKSGIYAVLFIALSAYVFIGSIKYAVGVSTQQEPVSLLNVIFSVSSIVHFLFFFVSSVAISTTGIIYYYFRPNSRESKINNEYSVFVKNFTLKLGLTATLVLPIIYVLGILLLPGEALSNSLFVFAVIILLIILIIANYFYKMLKELSAQYGASLLFLFVLLFAMLVIQDQYAFDTKYQRHSIELTAKYVDYQKEVQLKFGSVQEIVISGEDIFNGRCIACHQFDRIIVGPAYKDVLPKYEGKSADLVKFILNPVKVNPSFPAMTNQGLKPKEAEAIADYIVKIYKEKYK
ncbi:MAG: hypothetical protein KJ799_06800 [Bacteroidetes bacterium]|nr:hypothetical protein [Bacteroidota bacterium]